MATTWDSIFIRDDFNDSGTIPSGAATASHSPDIIPYGTLPMLNMQQALKQSWSQDLGKDVVLSQRNYLYVRGYNNNANAQSGQFNLYYAPCATILQPDSWVPILAESGAASVAVAATPSDLIAVPEQAFVWQNPQQPPPGQHYCLIATFSNATIPNPKPAQNFTSANDYVQWVVNSPNVGWRNIQVSSGTVTEKTIDINISNPSTQQKSYLFLAVCEGVPKGATVTMSCSSADPSPQIYYQVESCGTPFGLTSLPTTLPASWANAPVTITLQSPQGTPLTGASVSIHQILEDSSDLSDDVRSMAKPLCAHSPHPLHLPAQASSALSSAIGVRCGTFKTYFDTGKQFSVPRFVDGA